MSKKITNGLKVHKKLKKGVDKLANAVKVTLGAKGSTVIVEQKYGDTTLPPVITKDGVSVAKEIFLKDPIENMGAQMVKDVASKTNDLAGDGTTTATVLAQSIVSDGIKNITAGANPLDLKRGIDNAVKMIVTQLKKQSKEVKGNQKMIQQVATISSNNDSDIGEIIANAFSKVGEDGVITQEESNGVETYVDIVEGMQFDRGYLSPYFITDMEKQTANLESPYILIFNGKINSEMQIIPILEQVIANRCSILIIAEDVSGDALSLILANKARAGLKVACIKAPSFGNDRKNIMNDISIVTGGKEIIKEKGMLIEKVKLSDLGRCKKVNVNKNTTTIIGGQGKEIKSHVETLKKQKIEAKNKDEKDKIQSRLAKITGGVAVLYVGAVSEIEMKEKYDRVEDALNATKASLEEGVVCGGGVALIENIKSLERIDYENNDEKLGIQIVANGIKAPLKQIAINSGKEPGVVLNEVLKSKTNFGYDAKNDKYVDMFKAGIIDPTKVTRIALENAASVATMILTTKVSITNIK